MKLKAVALLGLEIRLLVIQQHVYAQGCRGAVSGAYSVYTSYAVTGINADGTAALSVSETIDGYANLGNLEYCPAMTSAIHTPSVYVGINGSGQWYSGPGKVATAYVDFTATAQGNVAVGPQFQVTDGAEATCSLAGVFYFVEPASYWPQMKISTYKLLSQEASCEVLSVPTCLKCTYQLICAGTCAENFEFQTESNFITNPCGTYLSVVNLYEQWLSECMVDVWSSQQQTPPSCS